MFVRASFYRVIALIVIAGLLFAPLPTNNLWWREAINSGHTLLFIFLSFIIHSQISVRMRLSNSFVIYLFVLIIGMLLGVAIEVLQSIGQRETSLNDIVRNFFGLMTGLCLIALFKLKKSPYQKFAGVVIVIATTGFLWSGLNPLLRLSWHYIERQNAFPVIVDFDANWSSSFVRYNNARVVKRLASGQQNHHLVQLNSGEYPGISIIEPEPDWSGYRDLHLKIVSMSEYAHYMILRVHDDKHDQDHLDRFNKKLLIKPGLNAFSISLNQIRYGAADRELDLKNIAGLILFSSKLKDPLQIAVVNISLK